MPETEPCVITGSGNQETGFRTGSSMSYELDGSNRRTAADGGP
jgi:hypothetical protein